MDEEVLHLGKIVAEDFEGALRILYGLEQGSNWALWEAPALTAAQIDRLAGSSAAAHLLVRSQPAHRAVLQLIQENQGPDGLLLSTVNEPSTAAAKVASTAAGAEITLAEFLLELGGDVAELSLDQYSLGNPQATLWHDNVENTIESKIAKAKKVLQRLWHFPQIQTLGLDQVSTLAVAREQYAGVVPGLQTVLGAFSSQDRQRLFLLHPASQFSLADVLRFSPKALSGSQSLSLVLFQLLQGLNALHSRGIVHGCIAPEHVSINSSRCVELSASLSADRRPSRPCLEDLTKQWCNCQLSNLDYLLCLNRLAGRRHGDPAFHPILPWVLDMTSAPEQETQEGNDSSGWRDLSKTKWRLVKGDEQLDFTYQSSEQAHHISDEVLSELTYCIYKARRLPKEQLTRVVRAVFEANEYPTNMQRLYAWTPDECIPEFYTDPSILASCHSDMGDLAVPDWADGAEDFILRHRAALESARVSADLHKWIDLMFGYKLSGTAALEAKNVALPHLTHELCSRGRAHLFALPHPQRSTQKGSLPAVQNLANLMHDLCQLEAHSSIPGGMDSGCKDTVLANIGDDSSVESIHRHETPIEAAHEPSGKQIAQLVSQPASNGRLVGMADDVRAIGCLVVQLYEQRLLWVDHDDQEFWEARARRLPASIEQLVVACLSGQVSAAAALRSSFFSPCVRAAAKWLMSLPVSAGTRAVAQHMAEGGKHSSFQAVAMDPEALALCLPALKDVLMRVAAGPAEDNPGVVRQLLSSFTTALPRNLLAQELLPLLASLLRGEHSSSVAMRAALLSPDLLHTVLTKCGLGVYLDNLHPAVISCLDIRDGGSSEQAAHGLAASAAQALCGMATPLGLPVTLEHILRPLLLQLSGGPHIALAVLGLASNIGPQMAGRHLLPPLLAVLSCSSKPASRSADWVSDARALGTAQLNSITIVEGLLPQLQPHVISAHLVGSVLGPSGHEQPSKLAATLLRPNAHAPASPQHRNRLAALLLQAAKLTGEQDGLSQELLPQLLPLFGYSTHQREAYGSTNPQPAASPRAQAAEESGYWDLIYILYPELLEAVGSMVMRELVPNWPLVERTLEAKYGWKASTSRGGTRIIAEARRIALSFKEQAQQLQLATSSEVSSATGEASGEALRRVQHTAMLIDGVGWSQPNLPRRNSSEGGLENLPVTSQASSGNLGPAEGQQAACVLPQTLSGPLVKEGSGTGKEAFWPLEAPESSEAFSGSDWQWLPVQRQQDAETWSNMDTWTSHHPHPAGGVFWARPWRLRAAAVRRWRAHREGLQGLLLHPNEQLVVTSGRGHPSHKDASVLRCWRIANAAPGIQYTGHTAAVTSMCFLPGVPDRVASCDQNGTVHVWSLQSGAELHLFREPSNILRRPPLQQPLGMTIGSGREVGVYDLDSGSEVEQQPSPRASLTGWVPISRSSSVEAGRSHGGFSCVAEGRDDSVKALAAGTTRGQVRWLDTTVGVARASILCQPAGRSESSAVTALEQGTPDWLVAGMAGGQIGMADARSGQLLASWRAHQTPLTALHLSTSTHQLLSASQEPLLKLWDLRKLHSDQSSGLPPLLHTFRGHREAVGGLAVHGEDAVTFAGPNIGICSLRAPFSDRLAITQPLNFQGGRDLSNIVDLGLLRYSHLLVLATEDGFVKIGR